MDSTILTIIEAIADKFYDRSYTIMKFQAGWRLGFGSNKNEESLSVGKTLRDALINNLHGM